MRPEHEGDAIENLRIFRRVDLARLYYPSQQEIFSEDGWSMFREYSPAYFGATWDEAMLSVEWEKSALRRLRERSKGAEDALLEELDNEWLQQPLGGLDLGIGGLVIALSAAGCAPLTSCSGHFGEGLWATFPLVKVAAMPEHAAILIDIARETDCGITNSGEGSGALEIWGRSVDDMVCFAEVMIARRAEFARLDRPTTVSDVEAVRVHEDQGQLFDLEPIDNSSRG